MGNKKPNYADEAGKLKGPKEKKSPIKKIKTCRSKGCPLNASTEINGVYRCLFHFSGDFQREVTMSIIENKSFIKTYNTMVKWKVSDWIKHKKWLEGNKNCPMKEKELPSIYVSRFFSWLSEKINNDATRHIENR